MLKLVFTTSDAGTGSIRTKEENINLLCTVLLRFKEKGFGEFEEDKENKTFSLIVDKDNLDTSCTMYLNDVRIYDAGEGYPNDIEVTIPKNVYRDKGNVYEWVINSIFQGFNCKVGTVDEMNKVSSHFIDDGTSRIDGICKQIIFKAYNYIDDRFTIGYSVECSAYEIIYNLTIPRKLI